MHPRINAWCYVFDRINDTHGKHTEDSILIQTGRRLQENIRPTDYAARWGGEEFIVLIPETSLE
ncbi:diguanylate cyclase domain-containing protein [Denitrovibrio acetiphilus]|uniref:diguanylate cyclase domain-containing protein n=1 Tax=Denitrovibrio acetiphilus TaxID=118000 RepID=UPI000A0622AE